MPWLGFNRVFIYDSVYVHCLGVRNCPDTQKLISKGLVAYTPLQQTRLS